MIASRSLAFIFLKSRKTASTSVEIVLSAWCGPRDICTPISPEDEVLRAAYGGSARNWCDWLGRERFYNHMPAREVARALPKLWRGTYRFTVERHPYEKVVSLAWFQIGQRGGDPARELESEIARVIEAGAYRNFPLYTIDGRLAVDEVWPYEAIRSRLEDLALRLDVTIPSELPHAKSRFRLDRTAARDVLSGPQRARIQDEARFEFQLMGYEP